MSTECTAAGRWSMVGKSTTAKQRRLPRSKRRSNGKSARNPASPSTWRCTAEDSAAKFEKLLRDVRGSIRTALKECKTYSDFRKSLRSIESRRGGNKCRKALLVCCVHLIAENDDLRLCENLFNDKAFSNEDWTWLCNAKMGRNGYTPLFRACYKGSVRMLKLLCANGADVTVQNAHDETVMKVLDVGESNQCEAMPANAIFIRSRFDECRSFVNVRMAMLRAERAKKTEPRKIRVRIPRRLLAAAMNILMWWRRRRLKRRLLNLI